MTNTRKAMQMALEALEESQKYVDASANAKLLEGWGEQLDRAEAAIQALRTELARVQEPASSYKVVPPNASGEANCTVRWMIETDLGWVGAYDKEALTNLLAAVPQTPERQPLMDDQLLEQCALICESHKVGLPSYFEIDKRLQECADEIRAISE